MDPLALLAPFLVGADVATILTLMVRPKPRPAEREPAQLSDTTDRDSLRAVRENLAEFFNTSAANPGDLLTHPAFEEGIRQLERRGDSDERLLAYYTGESILSRARDAGAPPGPGAVPGARGGGPQLRPSLEP